MARADTSLLQAVERFSSPNEDRLTEIFATVIAANPELAEWLARQAEMEPPISYEAVEVDTQVWTGGGADRVDMQLQFWAQGRVVLRVWSEHKTDSPFGPGQSTRYADAAEAGPKTGLLGITKRDEPRPRDPRWKHRDWQHVLDEVVRLLREVHGRSWRTAAAGPGAPAAERLLYELATYLQERRKLNVMAPDPLQSLDVITYQRAQHARDLVTELFEAVRGQVTLEVTYEPSRGSGGWYRYMRFSGSSPLAAETDLGWPDLIVSNNDDWRPESRRTGEPAFGVGHTFKKKGHGSVLPPVLQDPPEPLLQALGPEASIGEFDDHGRLYYTKYLAELVASGPSLQDQAETVARWAEKKLAQLTDVLAELQPPPSSNSAE